jgi:REP-associated tyrosine transposase
LACRFRQATLCAWSDIVFTLTAPLFYCTFTVVDWLPVFVSEAACKIVTESLNFCHTKKGLRINAYVIMPTHMHGIFFHETFEAKPLEAVLTDFRKFTGRQLADFAGQHLPPSFTTVFEQRAGDDRERRLWQPTRHPVQLETEGFWQAKFDYLHANPCRKGLVVQPEHWRFSSASHWLALGVGLPTPPMPVNDVILTPILW